MRSVLGAGLFLCALAPLAAARALPVSYELGVYSYGGFSANYLHSADGCLYGPYFMCSGSAPGSFLIPIDRGLLEGDYDGTTLNDISGELDFGANPLFGSMTITGGSLWATGGYLDYSIDSMYSGRLLFDPLGLGPGLPNEYSYERLILWGQNPEAYTSALLGATGPVDALHYLPLGIDLHATVRSVPEPTTMSLLGAGLVGLVLARRRRRG